MRRKPMPVLTAEAITLMLGPLYVDVPRSWRERWLSLPWTPWKRTKKVRSPKWDPLFKDILVFDTEFLDNLMKKERTGVIWNRS